MTRHAVAPLLIAAAVLAAGRLARAQSDAPRPAAAAMLADYAAGAPRQALFERGVPTEQAYRQLRGELFQQIRALREQGEPLGTIFLLDLSIWAVDRDWADAPALVRTAQDVLLQRPERAGASVPRDRIEVLYHRTALAMLTLRHRFREAQDYLSRLDGRVFAEPDPRGVARLVDPRLPLARARLLEAQTAPGVIAGNTEAQVLIPEAGDRGARQALERALSAFDTSARVTETAVESGVRRGLVLVRLGRHAEALAALDALDMSGADARQQYWRELFRGRALEGLERAGDAAGAYQAALTAWPGAQTPLVALASLFHRQGELDRAGEWAARARAGGNAIDPWWQYWLGEVRFVSEWLAELRVAHP